MLCHSTGEHNQQHADDTFPYVLHGPSASNVSEVSVWKRIADELPDLLMSLTRLLMRLLVLLPLPAMSGPETVVSQRLAVLNFFPKFNPVQVTSASNNI